MSEKSADDFSKYVCFAGKDSNDLIRNVCASSDMSTVNDWISALNEKRNLSTSDASGETRPKVSEEKENEKSAEFQGLDRLLKTLTEFSEAISSYTPLIAASGFTIPTMRAVYIEQEMYEHAENYFTKLSEKDGFVVFGVPKDSEGVVTSQIRKLREFDRGAEVLPGAILLSLVATFDSFIAEVIRFIFEEKPDLMNASEKKLSVKEIVELGGVDEIKTRIIEEEVNGIMYGSHNSQVTYLEKKINIKIKESIDYWGNFIEIFERRNLVAHGNCTVNNIYLTNCSDAGVDVGNVKLGDVLYLEKEYMRNSASTLMTFGASLMFSVAMKFFKEETDKNKIFSFIGRYTLRMIEERQYNVAYKLMDLALNKQTVTPNDSVRRTMIVNFASCLRHMGRAEEAERVLNSEDWSATTDRYKICVHALKDEIDHVVGLMEKLSNNNELEKSDFVEWPVFKWAREDEKFAEKFEHIYGEPLNTNQSL